MDYVAKKLAQTFLPINVIDMFFWIWGLLTLKYTGGDTVRQQIMEDNDNVNDENDLDHAANNTGLGTLK
jgi:hypothetical protein